MAACGADRKPHEQFRKCRKSQNLASEVHVLYPARRHARQHSPGLPARQGRVDHDEEEGVQIAAGLHHEIAEAGLHQEGPDEGDAGPDESLHCTVCGVSYARSGRSTTSTSSSRSKRAEGSTRISLRRAAPFPT